MCSHRTLMPLQLWSLGHGTTLWRTAPGLYYRMVGELIHRSIAAHGPPIKSDFDVKLVRLIQWQRAKANTAAIARPVSGTLCRTPVSSLRANASQSSPEVEHDRELCHPSTRSAYEHGCNHEAQHSDFIPWTAA